MKFAGSKLIYIIVIEKRANAGGKQRSTAIIAEPQTTHTHICKQILFNMLRLPFETSNVCSAVYFLIGRIVTKVVYSTISSLFT